MLSRTDGSTRVKRINLQYNVKEGDASALRLVLTLKPDWEPAKDKIKFTRFTDGITNTVRIDREDLAICQRATDV